MHKTGIQSEREKRNFMVCWDQDNQEKPNYLESLTFLCHRSGFKEMASVSQTFCSSCRTGSQGAKDYDLMYDMAMLYLLIIAKMDPRRIGRRYVSTKPFGYLWHPPKKVQCHSVLSVQANWTTLDVGKSCKTLSFSSDGNWLHKLWNSSCCCASPNLLTTPSSSSSSYPSSMLFCLLASLLQYLTLNFLFTLTILKSRIRKTFQQLCTDLSKIEITSPRWQKEQIAMTGLGNRDK